MATSPERGFVRRIPGVMKCWELLDWLIRKSVDIALDQAPKNLEREVQRRAMKATVDYLEKEMPLVTSYASRYALIDRAVQALEVEGIVAEFGVFKGDSLNYIAARVDRQVYGFDSFAGLPEDWRDGMAKGHFRVPAIPRVRANVTLIKGWFNETLPGFLGTETRNVAFLHVDCDLYSSTKTIFEFLGPRLVKGTVILFDDYFNYPGWQEGECKAFREFCQLNGRGCEFLGYCRYGEQVALRLK